MKNYTQKTMFLAAFSLGNLAALSAVSADDGELSPLTVVGGKDRVIDLVGSAAYIDTEDIRKHSDPNINRILAKVPGVYVREGKIDSAVVFDLSGYYQLSENVKILAGVNNLLDEEYVTSRVPHGPRNARGRHIYTGFEVKF